MQRVEASTKSGSPNRCALIAGIFVRIGPELFHGHFRTSLMPLLGVALLATGDTVLFVRFPPASDGNQMIHGQLGRFELFTAMITNSLPHLLLPPLRRTQLSGFRFFTFLMLRWSGGKEQFHGFQFCRKFRNKEQSL